MIGGGISGIACATALADAGLSVDVLDRGHRLGGRLATQTLRDTGTACDGSCGAASVRTKKTLLKTMKEEEVDVIERKVEYLCRHCAGIDAAPTACSCAGHGPAAAPRPWWKSLWPW